MAATQITAPAPSTEDSLTASPESQNSSSSHTASLSSSKTTASATSHTSIAPRPPSTSPSSPPPTTTTTQPKPTTTCTFDVWQYYTLTPDGKSLRSYINWSLGKADIKSTWSADHVDLQWNQDVAIQVSPDAHLQAPLHLKEVPDFVPPTIMLFWYGIMEWSTEDNWMDPTSLPYVRVTPGDGQCAKVLSAEYCDRRITSNFLC